MKLLAIFPALLLHGIWKLRWYHGLLLLAVIARQAWYASPYFMLAWYGEPDPSRYRIVTGTFRAEGRLERTGSGPQGWKPPRYFLDTPNGPIEFHCGYLPRRTECPLEFQSHHISGKQISLASDPYFGLVYLKLPEEMVQRGWPNEKEMAGVVKDGWPSHMRLHREDLLGLLAASALYIVLLPFSIAATLKRRKALS